MTAIKLGTKGRPQRVGIDGLASSLRDHQLADFFLWQTEALAAEFGRVGEP
jgi:hypothetical protein